MKIRDLFKFKPLALHTEAIEALTKQSEIPLTFPILDKSCLVGIEVEVENVPIYLDHLRPMWCRVEDNSLRNDGWEYVSAPLKGADIEYALRRLYSELKHFNPKYTFSGRTSIHVHMNARTMTCEQAAALLLLYVVFEKTLFRFVGGNRDKNHHCVPLSESPLTQMVVAIINGKVSPEQGWMKYTAVNILPLSGKGTIEFRQLAGTADVDRIMTWVHLLMCLKLYCYRRSYKEVIDEIVSLNTKSHYLGFANAVFGEYTKQLDIRTDDLADGSSLVKLYEHSHTYLKNLQPQRKSIYDTFGNPAAAVKMPAGVWDMPVGVVVEGQP